MSQIAALELENRNFIKMQKIPLLLLLSFPLISSGCTSTDGDTTKRKHTTVDLSDVVVQRSAKVQVTGLSSQKITTSCRGLTGDKMAVYIPHPATQGSYFIQAFELTIKDSKDFTEGYVKLYLCEATDIAHAPGKNILNQELRFTPSDKSHMKRDRIQVDLQSEVELPQEGVYAVFEWVYDRSPNDQITRKLRSAKVAGTFNLSQSYTWTSVGDFKSSWQHEGEANSLSKNIFSGHLYNALVGLVVRKQ